MINNREIVCIETIPWNMNGIKKANRLRALGYEVFGEPYFDRFSNHTRWQDYVKYSDEKKQRKSFKTKLKKRQQE